MGARMYPADSPVTSTTSPAWSLSSITTRLVSTYKAAIQCSFFGVSLVAAPQGRFVGSMDDVVSVLRACVKGVALLDYEYVGVASATRPVGAASAHAAWRKRCLGPWAEGGERWVPNLRGLQHAGMLCPRAVMEASKRCWSSSFIAGISSHASFMGPCFWAAWQCYGSKPNWRPSRAETHCL